jgi:hypothetical protein
MKRNNLFFLSGLPRTGATLLSSILNQNPIIHSEGSSPICRMMWDVGCSLNNDVLFKEILNSNRNPDILLKEIVSNIPKNFYKDITEKIIIDKNTSWTLPANEKLLEDFITESPKIIVLHRNLTDVCKSYVNLFNKNGLRYMEDDLLSFTGGGNPLMRPLAGLSYSFLNRYKGIYLHIDYQEMLSDTDSVLSKIYDFLELDYYDHDLNNIVCKFPENEEVLNIRGISEVRSNISRRSIDIQLKDSTLEKIDFIEKILSVSKKDIIDEKAKTQVLSFIQNNSN